MFRLILISFSAGKIGFYRGGQKVGRLSLKESCNIKHVWFTSSPPGNQAPWTLSEDIPR